MLTRGGAPETDVLEDRKIWIVLATIVAILVWWQWPELQDAAKMFGVERR